MSSEHTKEPWHLGSLPPTNWRYLCDETGDTVAAVAEWEADGTLIQEFKGAAALANARRIVACVNYCEGVSTAELEAAPKNVNLRAILNAIDSAAAREELVALLARVKP